MKCQRTQLSRITRLERENTEVSLLYDHRLAINNWMERRGGVRGLVALADGETHLMKSRRKIWRMEVKLRKSREIQNNYALERRLLDDSIFDESSRVLRGSSVH